MVEVKGICIARIKEHSPVEVVCGSDMSYENDHSFFFFFLRTTRDDYDIDVESPRRIRYDGLRRVSYSLLGFN